ncbi:Mo-dependent nitrogenase C-terminal domain-containing protein [Gloeothece verrucosa]|uniref:Mo-dependent nitrogenase family protein n=1 Tax=Gloeothece verrucosa (strain PCC 7822) TaxID=497965 RepID=E0U5A5_GLOV7|nr:Mo-dependent nitrogenase C-terminal domain-containing protein [Gloeothece verrucosa]ADN13495.1 Mo-dependent nitrogenase family protein [Gloeothece verrucosa PCC 7822]
MVSVAQPSYSNEQIATWLRGLLTIAWSDGDYNPKEQEMIADITHELTFDDEFVLFESITPEELVAGLGKDKNTAENFLRTAVLVAIADGIFSTTEADLLRQYSEALELKIEALESLEQTLCQPAEPVSDPSQPPAKHSLVSPPQPHPNVLNPLKQWLDGMEIHDPRLARFICKMVPPQCPFERDITLFGHKIVHIPPMCKLNPLYDQLVGLRFRALSYLADDCKEDITPYI